MRYAIGDAVKLRDEAVRGPRRELRGEVGRVGDFWNDGATPRCTVVYEARNCLIWDAPADDFEPAPEAKAGAH